MTNAVDAGLLFVYMEPGDNVAEQNFNNWYNNAPYPLTVPGFHTVLRYTATDALSPSYLAFYNLTDASISTTPAYTSPSATATAREKTLVPCLANLNRSVFSLSTTHRGGSIAPQQPPSTACLNRMRWW